MLPDSTKRPSPAISTSDSKVADAPDADSTALSIASGAKAVRRVWPYANVQARSLPGEPSAGTACPVNCIAKTSGVMARPSLSHGPAAARGPRCPRATAPAPQRLLGHEARIEYPSRRDCGLRGTRLPVVDFERGAAGVIGPGAD